MGRNSENIMTWTEKKLIDIVDFNPRETIKKGKIAKKIAMDKLQPFCRDVLEAELGCFSGGTKFRNGDTIMARITPCLENGKTAKINILEEDEVGFGSTEYIVFRAKEGIDADFIYYLVCSPLVREPAIKSMVGSSGRQRVQIDVIQNLSIMIPPLEEQKKIASVLKVIDDKITLNNKINSILEQQVQAIFTNMFGGRIDSFGNRSDTLLGDLVESVDNRGKTPPLSAEPTEYPIIDVKALSGISRIIDYNNCAKYVSEDTYNNWFRNGHPKPYDILISTVGSLAEMKIFLGDIGCIAQNVVAFRSKEISPLYLYQYLNYIKNDLIAYNIGSVQPSIKVTHIIKHSIYVPSDNEITTFDSVARSMTEKIFEHCQENVVLQQMRDILLPKLMYGEINISNINI